MPLFLCSEVNFRQIMFSETHLIYGRSQVRYCVFMRGNEDRSVEQDAENLGISKTAAEWLRKHHHLRPEWNAEQVDKNRKEIHQKLSEHELSKAQNYLALSDISDPRKLESVKTKLESVRLDYQQTLLTYRMLADIRFTLLAFIPVISGIAITLLSRDVDTLLYHPQITLVISVLGFVVTLGLAIYDQRNSQLHDVAIGRAQFLEEVLEFPVRKGNRGHMNQRKGEAPRRLFNLNRAEMWHDRALAWIYGAVLGAWWFPIWYALIVLWEEFAPKFLGPPTSTPHFYLSNPSVAGILAAITALLFIREFERLEGRPKKDKKRQRRSGRAAGANRHR